MRTITCGACGKRFSYDDGLFSSGSPAMGTGFMEGHVCNDCAQEQSERQRHSERVAEDERRHKEQQQQNEDFARDAERRHSELREMEEQRRFAEEERLEAQERQLERAERQRVAEQEERERRQGQAALASARELLQAGLLDDAFKAALRAQEYLGLTYDVAEIKLSVASRAGNSALTSSIVSAIERVTDVTSINSRQRFADLNEWVELIARVDGRRADQARARIGALWQRQALFHREATGLTALLQAHEAQRPKYTRPPSAVASVSNAQSDQLAGSGRGISASIKEIGDPRIVNRPNRSKFPMLAAGLFILIAVGGLSVWQFGSKLGLGVSAPQLISSSVPAQQPVAEVSAQISAPVPTGGKLDLTDHVHRVVEANMASLDQVLSLAESGGNFDIEEAAKASGRSYSFDNSAIQRNRKEARPLNDSALKQFGMQDDAQAAYKLLQSAFTADPLDQEIAGNFAVISLRTGHTSEGLELAAYALSLPRAEGKTGRTADWATLAAAHAQLGDETKARNALFVTLAIAPNVERRCYSAVYSVKNTYGPALRNATESLFERIRERGLSTAQECGVPIAW